LDRRNGAEDLRGYANSGADPGQPSEVSGSESICSGIELTDWDANLLLNRKQC
jgi:hypothetical protein